MLSAADLLNDAVLREAIHQTRQELLNMRLEVETRAVGRIGDQLYDQQGFVKALTERVSVLNGLMTMEGPPSVADVPEWAQAAIGAKMDAIIAKIVHTAVRSGPEQHEEVARIVHEVVAKAVRNAALTGA